MSTDRGVGTDRGVHWTARAACRDHDPELFFPVGGGMHAQWQARQAKDICHGCPVEAVCLAWALDTGQAHGVFGGTTEEERRHMRRERAG